MKLSDAADQDLLDLICASRARRIAATWLTLLSLLPVMVYGAFTVWGILATRGRPLLIVGILLLFASGIAHLRAISTASSRPIAARQAWLAGAALMYLSGAVSALTLFRNEALLSRLAWVGLGLACLVALVLGLAMLLENRDGESERTFRRIFVAAAALTMLWYVALVLLGPQEGGFPLAGAPTLMALGLLGLYTVYGEPLVVR